MSTVYEQTTWDSSDGWNGHTVRVVIPASLLAVSGSTLTLKLAYKDTNWSFNKVYIGHVGVGDAYDFDGTQVAVLFSGIASGTVTSGGLTSDSITYSLDEAKNVVVAIYLGSAATVPKHISADGEDCYYKSGDDAATTDAGGYTSAAGQVQMVENILNLGGGTYLVPSATTTDIPNAPSINTAFPPGATTTDTANDPGYSISFAPPSVTTTDTANAPSWAIAYTVATAYTIDTPNAPSMSGAVISQSITFPNLSGRQLSLEFINADSLGGSELYHVRLKAFMSNDRTDHYDNFPDMEGTHLGLEFVQSADADLTLAYASIGMLRRME